MAHIEFHNAIEQLQAKNISPFAAHAAVWLEACEYPGLVTLSEGLADEAKEFVLKRSVLGLDLQNVSCVHIGAAIIADVAKNGRVYLRNVRHGLFLLPGSVMENFGIGCPIDAGFALGGQRGKNPYAEKLERARAEGINVDDAVWQKLMGRQ